jgi:hypothetical protein
MDERDLDGTRIFNADVSSTSNVQNVRKHCIVGVKWQRCKTQRQLLLRTDLTRQCVT